MTLHTYTPQPMSLPSMNFLHLTVSEIQPGQTISRRPPAHPDTMGENNTPTALKGCGVKAVDLFINQKLLTSNFINQMFLLSPINNIVLHLNTYFSTLCYENKTSLFQTCSDNGGFSLELCKKR